MKLEFKDINPCILLDRIIEHNIYAENVQVSNDIEFDKTGTAVSEIANNVWVICREEDSEIIKNIVEDLNNTTS